MNILGSKKITGSSIMWVLDKVRRFKARICFPACYLGPLRDSGGRAGAVSNSL